ncbi:hypothetical protein JL722_3613 [Aureococcus anophagefferens]|nr:hypothetical protein JL722_3613 [Aureococcus anophagefferens]
MCWGNYHSMVEVIVDSPFDGIDVGGDSAPALVDLDGDGDLDLVVGEKYGTLYYYENVGSAASPSYEAVTGTASPFDGIDVGLHSAPAFADVDVDGDLDLVVGEEEGALYYDENVGSAASPTYAARTGTASPFDGIKVGGNYGRSAPAFADVDGDGDLDLVVGEEEGALYYYENVGSAASPSYAAVTGTANPFDGIDDGYYSAPVFADVDGDGDLDLVVGYDDGTLYYYENVGSAASPSYAAVTGAANPFDGIDFGAHSTPALGDLDGDLDLDLVVGEGIGALYYDETVGSAASPSYAAVTGTASPFDGIDVGNRERSTPALADLDGDGDLDLVVGDRFYGLFYYENVGSAASPSYTAARSSEWPYLSLTEKTGTANPFEGIDVGTSTYDVGISDIAPALADLDGDGDLDLVVGDGYGGPPGALYYDENVGNATSPTYAAVTGTANPFDGMYFWANSAPAFADLDGDGDLDLVVGEYDGGIYYYENVGSAASPSYAAVTGTANPFDGIDVGTSKLTFADLDGDGDLDLVVGAGDGVLYYYENVGDAASPSYAAVTGTASPVDGMDTFGWFLLLTFVVFPRVSASCGRDDFESFSPRKGRKIVTDALGRSVSATVLRFYNCVSFDEGLADGSTETLKVLEADFDISCTSSSYKGAWSAYALIMMFVFAQRRPYVADADDSLANVGNLQIILVFIASLMLFIKDMDEQAGAPGDMFKGPIFSACMLLCGTLVLIATIYTILVETCEVDPDEAARTASKSLGRPAAQVAPPTSTPQKEGGTEQTTDADRAVLSEILIEEEEADRPTELASPT